VAPAENHCAFDEILKFTDITWPGMGDKILPYFGGNFVDLLAHSLREYLDEVLHKEWDVLKTVSQGRHGDRKHVEPVIKVTAKVLLRNHVRKAGKSFQAVNKKILDLLQAYSWAGNVRELQNVIERSVIVCDTENFSVDESWLSRQPRGSETKSQLDLSRRLATQEKEIIEAALRESGGRVSGRSGAAAKLGIPGPTLESKIRSLKIDKYRFKTAVSSSNRNK